MRPLIFTSVLLAALVTSAAAHATPLATTYFHYSLDGGKSVSFTLDPSEISLATEGLSVIYNDVPFSGNPAGGSLIFSEPSASESGGFGPIDFSLVETNSVGDLVSFIFDGPQLYSSDESNPLFIPGTYRLATDSLNATTDNIVLTISQTPEPSSLLLLGTGALGCVGALRRRGNVAR